MRHALRRCLCCPMSVAALLVGMVGCHASAGPKVQVGQRVPVSERVSMDAIDHGMWGQLLAKYVDDRGRVDYQGWKASRADTAALDQYLNRLSSASRTVPATREGQFAFWINAYNAVTVKGILREYPTSSIRNHTAKIYGYNIWKDLLLIVDSIEVSLEGIEHQILRKMGDPRIHFAIVCASHSCPRLLNQAYVAKHLEDQLALNTKDFFANKENFRYDRTRQRFYLSAIMDWFEDDFGANQATRLKAIAPFLPDPVSRDAAEKNVVKVTYAKYDWSLNEQRKNRTK